jgi:cation diffusion facilitator CzcD-associated flavoprotein CzcO
VIRQEDVQDIVYGYLDQYARLHACTDTEKIFTVSTSRGTYHARAVVLAVGPGNKPSIPGSPHSGLSQQAPEPQVMHAMQIRPEPGFFPDPLVLSRKKAGRHTSILIVGGGLTSAQLADMAVRRGVDTVHLVMRSGLKVKHFDVDLEWMGKYRNIEQARFWALDTDEG